MGIVKFFAATAIPAAALYCGVCRAEAVVHRVEVRENLAYLEPGRAEKMDLYRPADPRPGEKFPGVVVIHGGSWIGGLRNADREINIGSNLARMGYVAISIEYRLADRENLEKFGRAYPVNVLDCKTAVQYLRIHAAELNVDPAKIGCIGGSAGGHLAMMLAVTGPGSGLEPTAPYPGVATDIRAAVNLYGLMEFNKNCPPNRIAVMGSTPEQDPENWSKMSPNEHVTADTPPVLQVHGKADTTVNYLQSVRMKETLDRAGVYNELVLLKGFGHAFSLQKWRGKPLPPMVRQRVLAFLDRHLKGISEAEAAERFAALESFEKTHPEAAEYGEFSIRGATVKSVGDGEFTVSRSGGELSTGFAYDLVLEKARRSTGDKLRDGMPVEVQGEMRKNGVIDCKRIVFRPDWKISDAFSLRWRGRLQGRRGILRRKDGGWHLQLDGAGKKISGLKMTGKTEVVECVPARRSDLRTGLRVLWMKGRNYGDLRKAFFVTLAERPPEKSEVKK